MFIIYVRDYGSSFRFQRKCCLKYEPLAYIIVRIANSSIRIMGLDAVRISCYETYNCKQPQGSTKRINTAFNLQERLIT